MLSPPLARFVPDAFLRRIVIVEVELPFAVIDVGEALTVDCVSDGTAVIEMLCAETEPRRLPARSFTFW